MGHKNIVNYIKYIFYFFFLGIISNMLNECITNTNLILFLIDIRKHKYDIDVLSIKNIAIT